jgi:hypothetical protein
MAPVKTWRFWLVRLLLALWGLQVLWLIWHFGPEAGHMVQRLAHHDVGVASRQDDPLYRWADTLKTVIPSQATYVFLDNYAAGKAFQVRYYLTPRRQILVTPDIPASFLFYALHQNDASFLILRGASRPSDPGVQATLHCPAVQPLHLPGPGRVFRVDAKALSWGFYD